MLKPYMEWPHYKAYPTCFGIKIGNFEAQHLGYVTDQPWRIGFKVQLDGGDQYSYFAYFAIELKLIKINISWRLWFHRTPESVDWDALSGGYTEDLLEDTGHLHTLLNDGQPKGEPLDTAVEGTGSLFEDIL